ncbi:MAG TPA: acyltransferase domain-containing protein, partial [Usitatibacter sp.]|nr:acyltransferase domain-containing protein [Usitatibacter sp.]
MGSALYESEPVFRAAFDECLTALQGTIDFDLAALVFSGDAQALKQTAATQPALFCIEYALARWWQASGAQPCVLLGHSVGEFVAATIGGVFRVEDAVRLVARRGQLMQALPEGAMLAVRAGAEQVAGRLVGAVSVAAENSPALCVIAGPADDIERTRVRLESDGIVSRPLHTSHAFHSSMMDPAIAPFEEALADVELSSPAIPIVSTVHGRTLHDSEARNPAYWARHLRETVRFSSALRTAAEATGAMFLEVGPRATLTTLARQHTGVRATASLGEVCAAEPAMLRLAAGRLWTAGFALDLEHLDRRSRKRRVALPSYPFERRRHW